VKQFIFDDVPLFHDAEFVRKPGEPPFLHFLNAAGERIETIDLQPMSREACNQELLKRGFYKKSSANEDVPDHVIPGQYRTSDEL